MSDIQVKVTTEVLQNVSADVTKKIAEVKNAFTELETIVQNSTSYWEGGGNDEFRQAYEIRKDDYSDILNSFEEHISNLLTIAGVYQQTENKVEELAQALPVDIIF